jgi:DNA-directed RNA polymerase subunit K/omega
VNKNMFTRDFDFKLEGTDNRYATCRALSRRARNANTETQHTEEEALVSEPNPAVTAVSDYAEGRIRVADENDEQED